MPIVGDVFNGLLELNEAEAVGSMATASQISSQAESSIMNLKLYSASLIVIFTVETVLILLSNGYWSERKNSLFQTRLVA